MKKLSIFSSMAIVAALIYVVCTVVAILYFPKPYSPLNNWLSDFGNPTQNPAGAIYYNVGGILTSAVLVLFFGGMYKWNTGDGKMKVFLSTAQISGIFFAFAFMVSAFFPLGVNDSVHSFASVMLFVFIGFFEIFSASAIRRNPSNPKSLVYFGFIAAMVNFAFGISFNFMDLFIGEWIMITFFIAYVVTLAVSQNRQINAINPKN